MPIRFSFDRTANVLFTKADGLISFEDINRHLDEESREGALLLREIVDATDAQTNLTPEETRQLVIRLRNLMRTHVLGPTAVITANDVVFGMARMFAILSDLEGGPKTAVFRHFEEGLEWLLQASPSGNP
jgi:hypothetical protein